MIGPKRNFATFATMAKMWEGYSKGWSIGYWGDATGRYLGLKFQIKGKTHYAWARFNVKLSRPVNAVLTGYAYETIPNKAIIAGKTKGPDVITERPATLGGLALGRK